MNKLKPCPCCGSSDIEISKMNAHVYCKKCGLQTSIHARPERAITIWNVRAFDPVDMYLELTILHAQNKKLATALGRIIASGRATKSELKTIAGIALIEYAKTPNTDFNLTQPAASQVKS